MKATLQGRPLCPPWQRVQLVNFLDSGSGVLLIRFQFKMRSFQMLGQEAQAIFLIDPTNGQCMLSGFQLVVGILLRNVAQPNNAKSGIGFLAAIGSGFDIQPTLTRQCLQRVPC